MKEINNVEEFNEEVIFSSEPVLVDFWAPWCAPCKMIAPLLEEVESIKVVKVNIENEDVQEIVSDLAIRSIPTLVVFKDSGEIDRNTGNLAKSQLENFISKNI